MCMLWTKEMCYIDLGSKAANGEMAYSVHFRAFILIIKLDYFMQYWQYRSVGN